MLVLAGVGLIFFPVIVGLCYGFVLNTVMMITEVFLLLLSQGHFCFPSCHVGKEAGMHGMLGGDTARTGQPN